MNDHDAARDELFELATALNDGEFTPAQASRLRELLTARGDLLPVLAQTLLLQTMLLWEVGGSLIELKSGLWRLVAAEGDDGQTLGDEAGESVPAAQSQSIGKPAPPTLAPIISEQTPTRSAGKSQRPSLNLSVNRPRWRLAMVSAISIMLVLFAGWQLLKTSRPIVPKEGPSVAHWVASDNCRLVRSIDGAPGGGLRAGQRIELASGNANVRFDCGADVKLSGATVFEVQSAKEGFLAVGQLTARAESPQAHGFTVVLPSAKVVDLGTQFDLVACADGHSQVHVSQGAVEVRIANSLTAHRLEMGQSMVIEPGSTAVTARIEPGDDTPAFHFPTIEPPSDKDYADASQGHATLRVVQGLLDAKSGPATVLNDGHAQHGADSPRESLVFAKDTSGRILMDLGTAVSVSKVNTYSWHKSRQEPTIRCGAPQKYALYGATGPAAPPTEGDLPARGWTPIARVNTEAFLGQPREMDSLVQQGVSITAASGSIGHYRYLLWEVQPAAKERKAVSDSTFYGEFDVYATPEAGKPSIEITSVPTDPPGLKMCDKPIRGMVAGGNSEKQKVVIYALSGDYWWVQPLATTPDIKFGADGKWESQTHGGTEFVALLVKSSYQPGATMKAIPGVGGDVLAIAKKKPETKGVP